MAFPIKPQSISINVPVQAFNNLIESAGIACTWMKSHSCPCVGLTGSPNPTCTACFGRGFYWDPPLGPFTLLLTHISWIGRNVSMGEEVDPSYGQISQGSPIITISNTPATSGVWTQADTKDLFVELDSVMRFQAVLRVNMNMTIPAWQILGSVTVAASGAVIVEDPSINQPVSGVAYTVSGGTVTLLPNTQYPTGFPDGTSYTVEYYSEPVFAIEEKFGGLVHARPFAKVTYPRRFKVQILDLFLRDQIGSTAGIVSGY